MAAFFYIRGTNLNQLSFAVLPGYLARMVSGSEVLQGTPLHSGFRQEADVRKIKIVRIAKKQYLRGRIG